MTHNIVTKKTLILKESESNGEFIYNSGKNDVYINSIILRSPDDDQNNTSSIKTVSPINGCYVIYFSSESGSTISTKPDGASEYTIYEYKPIDSQGTDLHKKKEYKRLDMMIDDDTSYSILRVNPKLTGNVKVVVDSESNMYLDTFKVSLGLSQNKYRHIPINPSEYYGRTLMSKMRSIPTDDFYKIEDTCYDLFATANDLDDQYYDKYNYGVRTNTDKMYSENYSLLAPLCIRKVLPDFFLIFKINDYESLFNNNNIEISDRTEFIDYNKCELIKSFDFRQGTKLGSYIRRILENNKDFVGDVYTGSDYDHFNIFNGISLEHGVVSNIYEETTQERSINNQVSMNDWYTLGFQRNHIVSKDIINFEFMFDDTSEKLFSLPTYFGVYVRLNGEDETFTCIGIDSSNNAIFDSSIHGLNFDPKDYPTIIYGLSTDERFKRLDTNISQSEEAKSHKLEAYKSIVTVDTYDISDYNNGLWMYASNKLNDVLDPGEHYRILDPTNNIIYEVIASNFFDDDELSDISYTQSDINEKEFQIVRISILNTEYRSNIDEKDKQETIKKQLNLIAKAFNKLSDNIRAYDDGKSSFSLLYKKNSTGSQPVMFEKISSICGFNKENDDIIINTDPDNEYIDKSSYIFGCDSIEKMIIDPKSDSFDNTNIKAYYPIGFESLGKRVAYCANFMDIVYHENGETMVLINDDIQKSISPYKTVLYTTKFNENKLYRKNITINYISIEDHLIVTKHTDPMYSIVGFGYQESYIIKFEVNPLIKANGKLQFYQNFPMNSGICSIFPLKDYYFDVLDQNSVFFVKNENDESESIRINGNKSEYSVFDKNVYQKSIIKSESSEEFISDYCDKFRTYNIDSSGFGYMVLDSENNLGLFLSNMQKNGHNKFDVSLISPYCCKWRILGTDMTGNRMRVMYNLTNPERESYSYDSSTWVNGFIGMDGSIRPTYSHKASPYINVSVYKDVRVNEKMKPYIDSVGYFFLDETQPITYWYWIYDQFTEFDKDLLNKSSYIRLSVALGRKVDGKHIDYNDIYISLYKNSNDPYLANDASSYWLSFDNNDHIGYLSYCVDKDRYNSIFTKYISDLYDEEETGSFSKYIYRGNGSIDDILYRDENNINKFSKIYKYGDNSIEFVSCGVKVRIKSTDKSMINLSRYVGYSVILLAMSGNNANQTGTYELFIDETKKQAALVVYNGIYSENNRINYVKNDPGIYRVKHSSKIADAKYENNKVIIDDDGFIFDCSTGLIDSSIFIISKPTDDGIIEIIDSKQIILTGSIYNIEDNHIIISSPMCAINGDISPVNSQDQIKSLLNTNNNVDAYIITSVDTEIPTHSLTLSNLKDLTSSYAISIKTENETKKYNNIASILSISVVNPFEVKRENSNYELITKGYIHPSYAVPVMNDIFEFEYKDSSTNEISDKFEMSFDGCNVMISKINKLKQTWMKKVIDIDNIMKQEATEYHKNVITPFIRYVITGIHLDGEDYINDVSTGEKYKEQINDASISNFEFTVETFIPDVTTAEEQITNTYTIRDLELLVKPGSDYAQWKSKTHYIEYGENGNFDDSDLDLRYDGSTNTWSGEMIIKKIGQSGSETLSSNETMKYVSRILIGTIDSSSNTSVITNLQYDSILYGNIKDSSVYNHVFFYDGTVINESTEKTMLSLRTNIDISPETDIKSFYFSTMPNDNPENCIKFDENYLPNYYSKNDPNGVSNLLHFTIDNVKTTSETKYKEALIQIRCDDPNARLYKTNGILKNLNTALPNIKYKNAEQKNTSSITISRFVDQSSSVTLLRNQDPLIGYWYTNMCRLFSKYDTYISYYGAFSGFEKNNYIASRGINLKTEDQNGNIIHGIDLTTWVDYEISFDESKIILNITSSIINFINSDKSNGYSDAWNKNQIYINSEDVSYSSYKSKYIENTILKLIDINNNTKFILYVDKSSDKLEFKSEKPSDASSYEEMKNLENTLVLSENRYYMNIENLEPHKYYAEMIIMF